MKKVAITLALFALLLVTGCQNQESKVKDSETSKEESVDQLSNEEGTEPSNSNEEEELVLNDGMYFILGDNIKDIQDEAVVSINNFVIDFMGAVQLLNESTLNTLIDNESIEFVKEGNQLKFTPKDNYVEVNLGNNGNYAINWIQLNEEKSWAQILTINESESGNLLYLTIEKESNSWKLVDIYQDA